MRLDYFDKAILITLSKKAHSRYGIEEEIRAAGKIKIRCGWLERRLIKLIHVGLIERHGYPATGQTYAITELGHKILKSCNRKDAKDAKE